MSSREVFSKTMPFVWAKLLLGLAVVAISVVTLALLMGIAWLFNSEIVYIIVILIWISITGIVNFIINHYFGYLVKAGHIAVIVETLTTGRVPENQVAYGKQAVKERFVTSNVYFALDKLVGGAVRQIQNFVEKAGGIFGFIPGMSGAVSIIKMFIGIALGYIDECCLGYTFLKKDQGAYKSAADGVVVYAQNWKTLLKDAAKTTLIVIVLIVAITLVTFVFFGLIFRFLGWSGIAAFLLACFVALVVKIAFIDSYMMVRVMVSYMEVAPTTVITYDLYTKLCGWSTKFKELFNKGQQENPTPQPATPQSATLQPEYVLAGGIAGAEKPVFCGECGVKNEAGAKFCGGCGKPLT